MVGWYPSGGPGLDLWPPGRPRYRVGELRDVTSAILGTSSHSFPSLNDSSRRREPSRLHSQQDNAAQGRGEVPGPLPRDFLLPQQILPAS